MVGADRPRQNAAFALEELRVIVAEKQARAAQSGKSVRIIIVRFGIACRSALILTGPRRGPQVRLKGQPVAELPCQFGVDVTVSVDPFVRAIAER